MTEHDAPILAIHPGALGDVILFGHVLAAIHNLPAGRQVHNPQSPIPNPPLDFARDYVHSPIPNPQPACRQAGPQSVRPPHITLVAGGAKARLLSGAGVVDAAVDFDRLPMHELFSDTPLDRCRLPAMLGRCGRIINCFVEADSLPARRLMRMCGAGELTALPIRPRAGFGGHLTELWRRQLGLAGRSEAAAWTIPPAWLADASGALKKLGVDAGRRYVVIHPGAGSPDKCWAIQRFLDVAASLGSSGMDVVFALGSVELERWPNERISLLRDNAAVLADAPLTQLAGVLAGTAALLGNDSGAAHLAAAVGAPTVVLFGPTSPAHFAPLGRSVTCLSGDTMDDIATSRVIHAVGKLC